MKKIKMPLIGIVATAMFTGVVSSVNMPFVSVAYADTKPVGTTTDKALKSNKTVDTGKKDAESGKTTDKKSDKTKTEATKTGTTKTDTAKTDTTKNDTGKTGTTKTDTAKTDTTKTKSNNVIEIDGTKVTVPKKGNKWLNIKGNWYFVKNGKLTTGWRFFTKDDGESLEHWSYFDAETGSLYTNWHWMGEAEGETTEHWSYFGNNGWLRTGWQEMGKGTDNPDGKAAKHWSYFGPNGWLRTGWANMGTDANPDGNSKVHWSYFGNNGWLRTGWQKMGKGTSNPDEKNKEHWSYFGDNGWLWTGWFRESKGLDGLRYFDESGWLVGALKHKTGWQKIGRVYYRFDDIGRINGANMPKYTVYDQIENNFLGACGPSASYHAAKAVGGLSSYSTKKKGYQKFVWDFYGMPYGTDDIKHKGVFTRGTSVPELAAVLKKNGVDATYLPDRQYTTDEVKDAIVHGQVVVPLMHIWYVGKKSNYWSQHYVAVTGWRQEGKSLQFFTADSCRNTNSGWADVNKDGAKKSSYGYNKYTGYNPDLGKAPKPRLGVGYSLKVGKYINLP